MWQGDVPELFQPSVAAMRETVDHAKVTGVFLSKDKTLGMPTTGEWTHLSAELLSAYAGATRSASEAMAEKKADFVLLKQSMNEFPIKAINQAVLLLKADAFYRSEKVLWVAEWFKALHDACQNEKNRTLREGLIWRAVALAPPGYCHVKNTMIGTLLDDILSGADLEDVGRRFAAKMHPLQYQRPQVAPSAGNIERAEKLVEKLGIQASLDRRFARWDEVCKLWTPVETPKPTDGGVFSHLVPKGKTEIRTDAPQVTITWRKFAETVLPDALSMECMVPSHGHFMAILTAQDPDAPPIIQWDNPEHRNPFSWYLYNGGSHASVWGLSPGWCKVTGISLRPSMWYDENSHQGTGAIFLLDGAKDSHKSQGNALFPETLKADLREVRSTIEAYSRKAEIFGYEDASACGMSYVGAVVRVKSPLGVALYKIDRWD
jgi:hypothetical protein